ncbi:hypothetical protein REPUB_Repub04eG0199200 [Reevesia pubescens]
MDSRRRPLHTCGVSAFAIAHKAYIKAQDLNEPFRSMAKTIATLGSLVSYLVYALQYIWLIIFFYVDDCILALENAVESVFPPSRHVFNKVDEIVQTIETLPGKFDDVLDKFHVIMEQVSLLDWVLGQAISWLKFLTSTLTHWDSGNRNEKEIVVDTGYNESNGVSAVATDHESKLPKESPSHVGLDNKETFPLVSEKPKTEAKKVGWIVNPSAERGTYKEVLESGKGEKLEKKEEKKDAKTDENPEDVDIVKIEAEDESSTSDGVALKNDSILELFDSGWLMKTPVKNAIDSSLPRSVSYTYEYLK